MEVVKVEMKEMCSREARLQVDGSHWFILGNPQVLFFML